MALDAGNVRVGITGGVRVSDTGTTAPTDSDSSYAAGWNEVGYISEDGVTEAHDDNVNEIVAWQNGTVVRSTRTQTTVRLSFTIIETKKTGLELFHPGSTISGSSDYTMNVVAPTAERKQFGLDVVDDDKHLRILALNAEVTERGDVIYQNGEPVGYPVTITCYPDDNGYVLIKLSDDAAWAES